MVAAAGLGALLASRRSFKGRVLLLLRPQEETGRGAPTVVSDPRLIEMNPGYIFGFHTIPGYPLGAVLYRHGLFAWAATTMWSTFSANPPTAVSWERGAARPWRSR